MLVLSRRPNERILFPTLGIAVEITSVAKNVVRLGIEAPPSVAILRDELASDADNRPARNSKPANHRLRNRLHTAALAIHLAQKQLQAGQEQAAGQTLNEALREYAELDQELAAENSRPSPKREIRALLVEDNRNESMLLAEQVDVSLPNGPRGLDGWFTKPVNPLKLIDQMTRALDSN